MWIWLILKNISLLERIWSLWLVCFAHLPPNFIFWLGRLIFLVSINSHPDNIYLSVGSLILKISLIEINGKMSKLQIKLQYLKKTGVKYPQFNNLNNFGLTINNFYMIYIIRNPILWLGISAYGGGVFVSLFFERRCLPDYFFRNVNKMAAWIPDNKKR